MLVKLIEVKRGMRGGTAYLNEIYVNSNHIISVSDDSSANQNLVNEAKQLGLVEGVKFSKISIAEGNQTRTLTVVGTPSEIYSKVKKRQMLRG
jgi:O-phosphoseryl-tRNA(Cys) synthetase